MKKLLSRLNELFEMVPDLLRKNRFLWWGVMILLTVFLSFGISRLKFDMTLDSWFDNDDPIKVAQNHFKALFGSDEAIFVVYKTKDGDVFSEKSLHLVRELRLELLDERSKRKLGEEGEGLLHIKKIDTLESAKVLDIKGDTLISRPLVDKEIPVTEDEIKKLRRRALEEPDFPLAYFSKNYQYGGLIIKTDLGTTPISQESETSEALTDSEDVEMDFESEDEDISMEVDETMESEPVVFEPVDMADYVNVMTEVDKILNQPKYQEHMEFYPVGNAPLMFEMMKMLNEIAFFYLGMLLIIMGLLWFLFRSASAIVWPVCVVVLATVWMLGILGWAGITLTTMVSLTIILLLAVGVADSVHILSGYLFFRREGETHEQALRFALRKSGLACLLTSVTTMMGMLVLVMTPINQIGNFGYSSALGVGLAFFFTVFLLPLMLDLWHPGPPKEKAESKEKIKKPKVQRWLEAVLPIVEKRPVSIILLFMAVLVVCVYGTTQVKVDSNNAESVREGHPIRIAYDIVDQHMMGVQNLEILIDMGERDALKEPKVLKAIEQLQITLEQKYPDMVVKTSSLTNVVKNASKTLNEGREEMYQIPDRRDVLEQTLFLFNNASPEDRELVVTDDYGTTHISVQLFNRGSYEYIPFFRAVEKDMDHLFAPLRSDYPDMKASLSGSLALIMELTDYISWSQVKSFSMALGMISLLLIFIFGSLRVGLLSVFPNLIPSLLTFGLMGLFGIPLDSDTLMIAPVVIGISVDDTIHFITHYRSEIFSGKTTLEALQHTIKEVGQAIFYTTLTLGFGFFILSFSSASGLAKSGFFGALAIFTALICDLFLLPALILVFKPSFGLKNRPDQMAGRTDSQETVNA